jgi:hypothetical protein
VQLLPETFLIPRRTALDMIKYVYWSVYKVPLCLSDLVKEWLNSNLLCINLNKTHFVQLTTINKPKPRLQITHLNKQISTVSNTVFLGIHINDTLNWKNHIDYIHPKLSRTCHAMRIIKHYMSLETLKTV